MLALITSAQASTFDWSGAASGDMSGTAGNWGGSIPGGTDTAEWAAATYTNMPTANADMILGELLFTAANTGGTIFGSGATT